MRDNALADIYEKRREFAYEISVPWDELTHEAQLAYAAYVVSRAVHSSHDDAPVFSLYVWDAWDMVKEALPL